MLKRREFDDYNSNFLINTTSTEVYDTTRSIEFSILGRPPLTIKAIEQNDGSILFTIDATSGNSADIRGLYFNIADPNLLSSLSISGDDISNQQLGGAANFKNGNNINGNGTDAYDIGLDIGTPGQGQDDISFTSFTLSSTDGTTLTLDLIAHMEFAARTTGNGQKITTIAPAAPDAIDDYDSSLEDTAILINATNNDTDADGDTLTIVAVGDAENGTVQIIDNQIRYTPNENWDGTDRFTYTIYDGDGGYDTATTEVFINAVADEVNLALDIDAGETVNDIVINITSSLVDTDGSESYILTFDNIPAGATLTGDNVVWIDGHYQIADPLGYETVLLSLSEGIDFDFDININAISTEASNNDTATTTESILIGYEEALHNFDNTYVVKDQSMWDSGNAWSFTDDRFIGVQGGFDNKIGSTVYADYDIDYKFGFQSTLQIGNGSVDASATYDTEIQTLYNKTTDWLRFETSSSVSLDDSVFSTQSPLLTYVLDLIAELYSDSELGIDVSFGGWDPVKLFGETIIPGVAPFGVNEKLDIDFDFSQSLTLLDFDGDSLNLLGINSGEESSYDIDLTPNGDLYLSASIPNFTTDSSIVGDHLESDGSATFLSLNADIDQMLATALFGGLNPFGSSIDISLVTFSYDLLNYVISGEMGIGQEFEMSFGDLNGQLLFEDGFTQNFVFGDNFDIFNASTHDSDGNGILDFDMVLTPDATFQSDLDLVLQLTHQLDILAASASVSVPGFEDPTYSIGPVATIDGVLAETSFNLYSTPSFSFDFGTSEQQFMV